MTWIVYAVCSLILLKWLLQCLACVIVAWDSRRKKRHWLKETAGAERKSDSHKARKAVAESDKQSSTLATQSVSGGGLKGLLRDWYRKTGSFRAGLNKYVSVRISQIPLHSLRMFVYRQVLCCTIEENVVVYKGSTLRGAERIVIGRGTIIGDDNLLDGRGGLTIGAHCNLSTGVKIWTAQHQVQSPSFAYESGPVVIGDRCWISGNTTILPGITLGEGCVIASGAVVTKDCEPFGIYAGIPAKKIGERNPDLTYEFEGKHDYFL